MTQVHALKSALASIGAVKLSAQAAQLEKAGMNGGMTGMAEQLDRFRTELEELTRRIADALLQGQSDVSLEESMDIDRAALIKLKEALAEEDIRTIDSILDALAKEPYTAEIKGMVSKLSEHVLMYDFDDAIKTIEVLLQ